MLKIFYLFIYLGIFSCENQPKTFISSLPEFEKKTRSKDSICLKVSKTCNGITYTLNFNSINKRLRIIYQEHIYTITSSKLIEELADQEMITDFSISCDCINSTCLLYTSDAADD